MKLMGNLKSKIETTFKEQLPHIKELITEKIGPAARGAAENKETCNFVSTKIYKFLPLPIRLLISESQFSEICWNNKHLIFPKERTDDIKQLSDSINLNSEMNKYDIIQTIYQAIEMQRNAIDEIYRQMKLLENMICEKTNKAHI